MDEIKTDEIVPVTEENKTSEEIVLPKDRILRLDDVNIHDLTQEVLENYILLNHSQDPIGLGVMSSEWIRRKILMGKF